MAKQVSFRIDSIREFEFSCKDPNHIIKDFKSDSKIDAGLTINYRWNIEKEIFAVLATFSYVYGKDNEKPIELLKLTIVMDFHVKNLATILQAKSPNDFTIDEAWEKNFVSITVSTGRGILFCKSAGTFYRQAIFPVIDPSTVLVSKFIKKK